ncbi:uncharacterized protein LOC129580015 [Sitodiplosis mosellana]|uniref:uncharacterized protein LOC129580015 n=1 Tax=Sitodiplosis mosellana TaxID=263140 RepID=UPI00244402E7|nr:uncharacterized protein LOC129580015 [Sitodiplosis mosellana]
MDNRDENGFPVRGEDDQPPPERQEIPPQQLNELVAPQRPNNPDQERALHMNQLEHAFRAFRALMDGGHGLDLNAVRQAAVVALRNARPGLPDGRILAQVDNVLESIDPAPPLPVPHGIGNVENINHVNNNANENINNEQN